MSWKYEATVMKYIIEMNQPGCDQLELQDILNPTFVYIV